MKTLIVANWKMHGRLDWRTKPAEFCEYFEADTDSVECVICPPFHLIPELVKAQTDTYVKIGAQNCYFELSGAYTGEISPSMLKDAGAEFVILGHSERRALFGETDPDIAKKAIAAVSQGLHAIICVGESLQQREQGSADEVVGRQIQNSIPESIDPLSMSVAYEPVWAIGTGLTPTLEDIAAMHDHIRGVLGGQIGESNAESVRILYGGSVKPENAREILALEDVNGALIGGASLDMKSFAAIANQA